VSEFSVADCVSCCRFAWILGFSVFLSSSAHRGESKPQELMRIAVRGLKLFGLGLFVNNGDNWSEWRIPGVLQALSVAYLVVASADCCFSWHKHSTAIKTAASCCTIELS
jgi:predicted acyltransferase